MGLANHAGLARKIKLRNEILKHAMANDREKEQAARKKLDALNKQTAKKKKKKWLPVLLLTVETI